MKRLYLCLFLTAVLHSGLHSQSPDRNYILTRRMLNAAGTTYLDEIQYFDGLGQETQKVRKQYTPGKADLVSLQEFDALGREIRTWKETPFAGNGGGFVTDFKGQAPGKHAGDLCPYVETDYESSSLNRILKRVGYGAYWHNAGGGRGISTKYLMNSGTPDLRVPLYSYSVSGNYLMRGTYHPVGQLYALKTTDENGNVSFVFTDKKGNKILERQVVLGEYVDTYYIYDDYDNKICVLPPNAVEAIYRSGTYTFAAGGILDQYAYLYKYDHRNRCVEKKLPGCKPVYMVYDKADHLVLSQDGNQRSRGVWLCNKYDYFDRIIYTCEVKTSDSHASLKTYYADKVMVENFSTGLQANRMGDTGYSCNFFASQSKTPLTVYYYDDYRFLEGNLMAADKVSALAFVNKNYGVRAPNAKGLLTGMRTYLLDGTNAYTANAYYYDFYGNVIQRRSGNHLGGYDHFYYSYTFTGKQLMSYHEHTVRGSKQPFSEDYFYTYDPAERLKSIEHWIGGRVPITICSNTYDEAGRLASRKLGSTSKMQFSYSYNVRDWLTSVSSPAFSESLSYETYNGNISKMRWKTEGEAKERVYSFTYDQNNRIKYAAYGEGTTTQTTYNSNYNVEVGSYDKQGNILQLIRRGMVMPDFRAARIVGGYDATFGIIDNLTYRYKGNQLSSVSNLATSFPYYKDAMYFTDGCDESSEYIYDDNGNMVTDKNKGIESIAYNFLNLPDKISRNKVDASGYPSGGAPYGQEVIAFLYDADGNMLGKKYVTESSSIIQPGDFRPVPGVVAAKSSLVRSKLDYCGSFIYENDTLRRILIPDGYVELNNGRQTYYYYAKDHQGNNRVVADQVGSVKQVNHYYPFGGLFGVSTNGSVQSYKYNGKELERMHGLDWYFFGNRMQDPVLGRFHTMDRFCENYYALSPYQFAANNPFNNIDVNGDSISISVKSTIAGTDGFSTIQTNTFIYSQTADGNYGFMDRSGQPYTGNDPFISDVTSALNTLRSGARGKELVDGIAKSENMLEMVRGTKNYAEPDGTLISWDPQKNKGGIDQNGSYIRPTYIGLGHELAHIEDMWRGTYDNSTWAVEGRKEIHNAEKYSVHVENQLRSEHSIPLRTHYGSEKTRFLHPLNNSSLFFRKIETINNSLVPTPYTY